MLLPYVVQLMLDQCAPFSLIAFLGVGGVQGDKEVWHAAKPLLHLLLLAQLGPGRGAEYYLFALANHSTHFGLKAASRPQHLKICIQEVGVIWVVQQSALFENRGLYPGSDQWGWGKAAPDSRLVLLA